MSDPLKQREKDIEKATADYAKKLGWTYRKQQGQGDRGKTDSFFIRNGGQIVFVEFKRPGGKLTRLQEIELNKLDVMGFTTAVIDNIEDGEIFFDYLEMGN